MLGAVGVKGQYDKGASSEGVEGGGGGGCWYVGGIELSLHSANLENVCDPEVTVPLANESDLLPLHLSLPLTHEHIHRDVRVVLASPLMHTDSSFDGWVGWLMGLEVGMLGRVAAGCNVGAGRDR